MDMKNLEAAAELLRAEAGAEVADDDLDAYMGKLNEVVAAAQAVRAAHKAGLARRASQKSRAKKAQEVAELRERLARFENTA